MDKTPTNRVVLIDLENFPFRPRDLAQDAEELISTARRIVLVYARGEPSVPLTLVQSLADGLSRGRVVVSKMAKAGRNAVDFGLTFWAGRLMAEEPEHTEFVIVSEDEGLDHAVMLLQAAGRQAKRLGSHRSAPRGLAPPSGADAFMASLERNDSWPAKIKALRNAIRSYLRPGGLNHVGVVLEQLMEEGHVVIGDNGRVTYPGRALTGNGHGNLCAEHDGDCIPF